MRPSGINPGFPGLSRSSGQIGHVLRTRSPLRQTPPLPEGNASLDLHALGAPPAFVLSQDQTLQRQSVHPAARPQARRGTESCLGLLGCVRPQGRPGRKGLIRPAGGKTPASGSTSQTALPSPGGDGGGGMTFIRLLTRCLVVKEPRERIPVPRPGGGDGRPCGLRFLHQG